MPVESKPVSMVKHLIPHTFSPVDYVQTGPYNKAYTESQLQAGGGFILPDFNEEQVGTDNTSVHEVM